MLAKREMKLGFREESDLGLDVSIDFEVSIRFDLDLPILAIRIIVAPLVNPNKQPSGANND
jgi:hypothetical protein